MCQSKSKKIVYVACDQRRKSNRDDSIDRTIGWRSNIHDNRHSDESAAKCAAISFHGTIWPKIEHCSVRLCPSVPLAVPGRLAAVSFTSLIHLLDTISLLPEPCFYALAILVMPVSSGEKHWFHSAGMVTRCARRTCTHNFFVPIAIHYIIVALM